MHPLVILPLLALQPTPVQEVTSPAAAPAEVTMLRFFDGAILWGRVDDHDAEGLGFVRLDNGGRVRIAWALLDSQQAEELQRAFGYVDDSEDELTIEADRLVLDDGMEWIGRIVNRTTDEIWLKTASALVKIPKLRLRGAATVVQAPALDVYTGEELYQQELARTAQDDAAAHYELARFCELILEYERAALHYRQAADLDPTFRADELPNRLARAEEKAASRAQVEYLREIDTLRARGRFDEALSRAEAFDQVFPDSTLSVDATRKRERVERALEATLRDRTPRVWRAWIGRLAQHKARDPESTLDECIAWAEESMSEEVLTATHRQLVATVTQSVTPQDVQRYFAERKVVGVEKASYGEGTWLLGPEGARAGVPEQAQDLSKLSELERERAQYQERLGRYLQNQTTRMASAKPAEGGVDERQSSWRKLSSIERKQWLEAYYAEHSGDVRLVRVELSNCAECGGSGVREMINVNAAPSRPGGARGTSGPGGSGGGGNAVEKVACPLCHNVGVVRRVAYR